MARILVVDDDAYIRELVCTLLRDEGHQTLEAMEGRQALETLHGEKVDLCVLDLMMPGMDGYEFCQRARRYYDLPILMLTAKGETLHKIKGFNLGADDYLVKPFDPGELSVRIRALLRRCQIAASQRVEVGRVTVDQASFTVTLQGGGPRDIPRKEFELLFLLGSYPGKTLTRDRLIEEVWGLDFEGNERTLDVHINRLRERFDADACGFRIATVRGLGYRLEVLA